MAVCTYCVITNLHMTYLFSYKQNSCRTIEKITYNSLKIHYTLKNLYCLRNNGENKNMSNQSSQSKLPLEGRIYLLYLFHITNEVRMAASYHFFFIFAR